MLCQSYRFGDLRITRVLEMSGPTHDPAFLFPDLPAIALDGEAGWLAPHHYQPSTNRLVVTIQIWMVQFGTTTVLIDPGIGNGKPRPAERQNMLNTLAPAWLAAAGATADSVTDVILTHLHADHVGGCTVMREGVWRPAFPGARHHMPRAEFDYVRERYGAGETGINSGAWADSVIPLIDAGLVDLFEPGDLLLDHFRVEDAAGHTPGQVALWLTDKAGGSAVFAADIMHSPLQIRFPALNTRYCIWPERARETRAAFLAQAARSRAIVMPMHFGWPYRGLIARSGDTYTFAPLDW
ncbi:MULTISPECIES: MBL fold metallo-hydrolase [unclassified Chelatococcus]|uniref:MBL fold metallo-hydrolase n=1 Tax=unclassified Chelatococcus TaxID=2638111 RepID=UPI001BCCCC44|nr:MULTISPECIES: MBL fold metallo-hydrolase [unclassified Chelatococcus]MBS7697223.1 MBL fold metallo-hydrolase [Chelatococcus sp. YT9]MBX3556480.1 MBL fold metallo-hydrolase [Chelatococcus sp.]